MSSTRSPNQARDRKGGAGSATDARVDRLLQTFWVERLVPTAEALRRRGVKFFDSAPRPDAASYFVDHPKSSSPFFEIERDSAAAALSSLWTAEGYPELAALARPLLELAPALSPKKEDAGDVSPFMYVMF